MNTRIRSSKPVTSLAALLAASGALLVTASPALASADGAPDYGPVLDPLSPATHLLRNDDLAVTLGWENPEAPGVQLNWISSIPTLNSGGVQCEAHDDGTLCESGYDAWDYEGPPTAGRFFDADTDFVVALGGRAETGNYTVQTWAGSGGMIGSSTMISQPLPYPSNRFTRSTTAIGDFNRDGVDDLVIGYSDWNTQFPGNARVRIATAVDVDNPSRGFDFGHEVHLPTSTTDPHDLPYSIRSLAAGDFNGDGQPDLAILYIDDQKNPNIAVYSVDSSRNLQLQETNLLLDPINYTGRDAPMQLVAGTFVPGNHQQLALVHTSDSYGLTRLHVFDFDAGSYYPREKSTYLASIMATKVRLIPGQFDWSTQAQALVLMTDQVATRDSKSDVKVLRMDPKTFAISVAGSVNVPQDMGGTNQNYVALDIAVGNFDNTAPPPGWDGGAGYDAGAARRDPNLQLAIGIGNCLEGCPGTDGKLSRFQLGVVNIYDVIDRTTGAYALKKRSAVPLHPLRDGWGPVTRLNLLAADLEGRSVRLGSGVKIAIERTSPTVIVAQPPSHVDYAKPNPASPATVVNLGFAPDKFHSTFAQTGATDTSLSRTDTKSWGFTGKISVGSQIKVGTINEDGSLKNGVDVQACFTAEQDENEETDSTYGASTSFSETISTQTSTNDVVWYESGYEYLYIYEAVGKTVCPSGQTTCDAAARVPLTVMFTAPGSKGPHIDSGDALPWYQPVWENGNILSYPANMAQLSYGMPQQQVMATSQTVSTDGSGVDVSTTWTNNSTNSGSYTYSKQFRENGSLSVEYSSDAVPFRSATAKLGVKLTADIGGSDGMSAVRTQSTTVSASNNLTMEKQVNFKDPGTYVYSFTPYVLGGTTPPGYLDGTDAITPGSGLPPNPARAEAFGPLRTAFTVDPLSKNAAFFRNNYGKAPDIALNHPGRWYSGRPGYDAPIPSNCLDTRDGYMDCAYLNDRLPAFPGSDTFHKMRGFFVFNAGEGNPADPANQGMQQVSTTVGHSEVLEARVYNYSLMSMPGGSTVHVRFYGMPWDVANGCPVDPNGASFLIGQYDGNSIPPFSTTAATPNYILATTTFDATGHDNQDLMFWVVAWGENVDGSLMGELDGKGLTSNPRSASSSAFVDLTDLEPLVVNQWPPTPPGDAGPVMTSFSNNIGIFPQVFHVFPATSSTDLQGASALSDDPRPLAVSEVRARQTALKLGEPTEISARVHNPAQAMRGANAYFYDGDPQAGGKPVGMQRLSYMNAGGDQKVMTSYAPRTCGTHDIYVSVGDHGVENGAVRALDSIQVTCDPPNLVRTEGSHDCPIPTPGGDGEGGCSVARRGTAGAWGLFAPLAAVAAALWARRKRKA